MKLEYFSNIAELHLKNELEKIELLAFYFSENKNEKEFRLNDLSAILVGLGFAKPNESRLKDRIKASKSFVKGSKNDLFRLSVKRIHELKPSFPNLSENEEIMSDDSLLPEILFKETKRNYLLKIAQQINASYEHNLYDSCALMMRRLLEILLISTFEAAALENAIKDEEGNYQSLKILINKAKSMPEIKLSSDTKKDIDSFRELGNLSAHRIKYNCRKEDIKKLRIEFRAVIEELLYTANFIQMS